MSKLTEQPVTSSWIADLAQPSNTDTVEMTLKNGRKYRVNRMDKDAFLAWVEAGSKGKWWHQVIKGNHRADRR